MAGSVTDRYRSVISAKDSYIWVLDASQEHCLGRYMARTRAVQHLICKNGDTIYLDTQKLLDTTEFTDLPTHYVKELSIMDWCNPNTTA